MEPLRALRPALFEDASGPQVKKRQEIWISILLSVIQFSNTRLAFWLCRNLLTQGILVTNPSVRVFLRDFQGFLLR